MQISDETLENVAVAFDQLRGVNPELPSLETNVFRTHVHYVLDHLKKETSTKKGALKQAECIQAKYGLFECVLKGMYESLAHLGGTSEDALVEKKCTVLGNALTAIHEAHNEVLNAHSELIQRLAKENNSATKIRQRALKEQADSHDVALTKLKAELKEGKKELKQMASHAHEQEKAVREMQQLLSSTASLMDKEDERHFEIVENLSERLAAETQAKQEALTEQDRLQKEIMLLRRKLNDATARPHTHASDNTDSDAASGAEAATVSGEDEAAEADEKVSGDIGASTIDDEQEEGNLETKNASPSKSTPQKSKRNSQSGNSMRSPRKQSKKPSLLQTRETIRQVCIAYDARADDMQKVSLCSFVPHYMKQHYGLRSIVTEMTDQLWLGVEAHCKEHDVAVFGAVCKDELDYAFRQVESKSFTKVKAVLMSFLKNKYPHKQQKVWEAMLNARISHEVDATMLGEEEWSHIVKTVYPPSVCSALLRCVRQHARKMHATVRANVEDEMTKVTTSVSRKRMLRKKLQELAENGSKVELQFFPFFKTLLNFQLGARLSMLRPFITQFRQVRTEKHLNITDRLDEEEFVAFVKQISTKYDDMNVVERLVDRLDAKQTGIFMLNECIDELLQDFQEEREEN